MSQAVHTPGCIKGEDVSECKANKECIQEALIPEVVWNKGWHYHIEQSAQELVVSGKKWKPILQFVSLYTHHCHTNTFPKMEALKNVGSLLIRHRFFSCSMPCTI